MTSFLAILLQNHEREILMEVTRHLTRRSIIMSRNNDDDKKHTIERKIKPENRSLDVYIHDGGLLRKLPNEHDFPTFLLDEINEFVKNKLLFKFVQFTHKPFDLSMENEFDHERQIFPEFNYLQWKYHLEKHRDLCYISDEKCYFFADNSQTIIHTNIQTLKHAMGAYTVWEDEVPQHLLHQSIEDMQLLSRIRNFKKTPKKESIKDSTIDQPPNEATMSTIFRDSQKNHNKNRIEEEEEESKLIMVMKNSLTGLEDDAIIHNLSDLSSSLLSNPPSALKSKKSNASQSQQARRVPRRRQFVDIWQHDKAQKQYDKICFSERTNQRNYQGMSFVTPTSHLGKFSPEVRFIFQGWDLLTYPNDEEEELFYDDTSHMTTTGNLLRPLLDKEHGFLFLLKGLFPEDPHRDYILNWIAHLFQKPDERIVGTCLVLLSTHQGTGKTTLLEAILNLLMRFGRKLTKVEEDIFKNFTNALEYNILLGIDDASTDSLRNNYEDLKGLITSEEARVRELYTSARQIITNARFMIVSNNPQILKLEEGSRRFAIFEPSTYFLQEDQSFLHDWHNSYWILINNRKAVLKFLLNHPIPNDWHPERSYPSKTTIKKQIEAANLEPLAIYNYALGRTLSEETKKEYFDAPAKLLFAKFKLWVDFNYHRSNNGGSRTNNSGFRIPSKNEFPLELRKLGIFKSTDETADRKKSYHSGTFYQLPLQRLTNKAMDYCIEPLDHSETSFDTKIIMSAVTNDQKKHGWLH
jgi:hypothetical protein